MLRNTRPNGKVQPLGNFLLIKVSPIDRHVARHPSHRVGHDESTHRVVLADAESNESRLVHLGRADVERRAAARRQQIERRFRSAGVDRLEVSTAVPYDRDLLRFFRERALRR